MPDVALVSQQDFLPLDPAASRPSPLREWQNLDQELEAAISESKRNRSLVDLTSASQRPNFRTLSTSSSDAEPERHQEEKRTLSRRKVRRRQKRSDSSTEEEGGNAVTTNDHHRVTAPVAFPKELDKLDDVKRSTSSTLLPETKLKSPKRKPKRELLAPLEDPTKKSPETSSKGDALDSSKKVPKIKSKLKVPDIHIQNDSNEKSKHSSKQLAESSKSPSPTRDLKADHFLPSTEAKLKNSRNTYSTKDKKLDFALASKHLSGPDADETSRRKIIPSSEDGQTPLLEPTREEMHAKQNSAKKKKVSPRGKRKALKSSTGNLQAPKGVIRNGLPKTPPSPGGVLDLEALIAAQDSKSNKVSHKDIQGFLHRSRMHLKVEDVRRHMDIAKAIGTMDTKKLKSKARNARLASLGEEEQSSNRSSPIEENPASKPPSGVGQPRNQSSRLSPNRQSNQANLAHGQGLPPKALEAPASPSKTKKTKTSQQVRSDGAKRLELIKAARKARKDRKDPEGLQEEKKLPMESYTMTKMQLPIVIDNKKRNRKAEKNYANADEDFYKDFKIIFVNLPMPKDDQPREYLRRETVLPERGMIVQLFVK